MQRIPTSVCVWIVGLASIRFFAARADEATCASLQGRLLPSTLIALPTDGAVITSSEVVAAAGQLPSFCKVLGNIKPVDKSAPLIKFEVNLPDTWNHAMIQYGGGGLNGRLETAIGALRDDPPNAQPPLARGYATFGTDGGHEMEPNHDIQSFAFNQEALINHAYAAYKKTHDIAVAIAKTHFGSTPTRVYFIGGSEGGREAMVAVQRFPKDYAGAIASVPVLSWTGTNLAGYRQWQAMSHGGWMDEAKVKLVQSAVVAACDKLDGIEDGVVARYEGCQAESTLRELRCPTGQDTGDECLSDQQLQLVRLISTPHPYGFDLAHGEHEYAAYPVGGEANPGAYIPTIVPRTKPAADDPGRMNYSAGDVRYFIVHDPAFSAPLDERTYEKRIKEVSALMDMNDPDLSKFAAHGGKLIIKENGADFLVAPGSVYRYYTQVQKTMGKAKAESFVRLYVAPWTQHGGQGLMADGSAVPSRVDLLTVLENWVEHALAPPEQLVLTSYDDKGNSLRSWPLCRYGSYPHFLGMGDPRASTSYECRQL